MEWLMQWWAELGDEGWKVAVRVGALLVLGLVLARSGSALAGRLVKSRGTPQHEMLARRGVLYLVLSLTVLSALRQLGVDLGVLLGAAGILTVAIGFASQTSASNVISGLFLLGEQPFVVGDVIAIGATKGEVVSIDLLSVKLRTFDNLYVRVPNESLIKSDIVNMTRFPIRRMEVLVAVSYATDLEHATAVLLDLADRTTAILVNPAPEVHVEAFADSGVQLRFLCWTQREGWYLTRSALMRAVRAELADATIEIPHPKLDVTIASPGDEARTPIQPASGPRTKSTK